MKILVTRKLLDKDLDYLRVGLDRVIDKQYEFVIPPSYDEQTLLGLCSDVDVFLGPYVTRELLNNAANLKLIQVPWTGMDNFDFAAVRGFNVTVCNTHSNANSVAEICLGLALDLVKKISYHDRKMRLGNWNRDEKPLDLKSRMISGANVCILGCGNIGYRVAKLFNSFGAIVSCVDDFRVEDNVVEKCYASKSIMKAVEYSDIIICCLPLTNETKGIINFDFFKSIKRNPYFINVSRAAIINEDALLNALQTGTLAGYASDVWWKTPARGETESYPSARNEFWKFENVIMSPHRAGFVEGALPHLDGAIENLINYQTGKPLKCIVDIEKGY